MQGAAPPMLLRMDRADAATASFTSPPGTTATASVAGSFLAPAPAMILRPPWLVAIDEVAWVVRCLSHR